METWERVTGFLHSEDMDTFSPADQALFEIDAAVAKHGFYVNAVFGDNTSPPWAYTIGLLETHDHPELITFGLPPRIAYGAICRIVDLIRSGTVLSTGRDHPFDLDGIPACLIPVLDEYWRYPCDYLLGCPHYYGAKRAKIKLRALQMVWSDEHGRMPWEPSFQAKFAKDQVLLDEPGQCRRPDDRDR